MKRIRSSALVCLCGVLPLAPTSALARERLVRTPAELTAALAGTQPGDIVTLRNGDWKDARIVVTHGGASGTPVEIRAESPGRAVLAGSSILEINAPNVTVAGLLFHRGAIAGHAVIQFNSHHGIVRDTDRPVRLFFGQKIELSPGR